MNIEIIKGKDEFENGNYEMAIEHLDKVDSHDENYDVALFIKAVCLKGLKEYKKSLKIFNEMIGKDPYNQHLWFEKAFCHYYLKDGMASDALRELDRVVDKTDKSFLVNISRLYFLVKDYDNALKYCDYALAVDSDYKDALYEKLIILSFIDDDDEIHSVCDKIVDLAKGNLLSLMPVFMHNIFAKNYRACMNLIASIDADSCGDEHIRLLKGAIYKSITEDLSVCLVLVNVDELSIDDALEVMIDYVETGKDEGVISGIKYFII